MTIDCWNERKGKIKELFLFFFFNIQPVKIYFQILILMMKDIKTSVLAEERRRLLKGPISTCIFLQGRNPLFLAFNELSFLGLGQIGWSTTNKWKLFCFLRGVVRSDRRLITPTLATIRRGLGLGYFWTLSRSTFASEEHILMLSLMLSTC